MGVVSGLGKAVLATGLSGVTKFARTEGAAAGLELIVWMRGPIEAGLPLALAASGR